MKRSVITGTGSYIPTITKKNDDFIDETFYNEDGSRIITANNVLIEKFKKITGIEERRYATSEVNTSDMALEAARMAITDSQCDPETIDIIIVAHNFGDVSEGSNQVNILPSIANRVKNGLQTKNAGCMVYDLVAGCPGWIMALMQADALFKAGLGTKALIIGAETLSRVIDKHDRDSMLFSDGAGAVILEYREAGEQGLLCSSVASHSGEELNYLQLDLANHSVNGANVRYMKMKGKKVYEYALKHVPEAMKQCFDKSGKNISDLKKIFLHQANEKMDEAIVDAFYKLYNLETPPHIMPMCIHYLGNSSVATIPTLFDLVKKGADPDHHLSPGDTILFASVGAGMNINAACYVM